MRFISLLALFACFSFPAQAQYTTNSKSAAPAAKAQPATARRPAAQVRPTQAAAQQNRPAAARVRPQAAATEEGDSDMPSFEAFAKPAAAAPAAAQGSASPAQRVNPYAVRRQQQNAPAAQGSAQGSHQIVWPKGEIWVYMSDFSWGDIDGAFVHCEWKAVLQNRTDTTIDSLKITFVVRESYSELTFNGIKPRGADVQGMMVYSDLCPAMQGVKPKVSVLSCRMGDISGSDCSKYVVIK